MRILKVEADNFRSYKKLSWTLTTTGLTLIDGQNLDTGRSNMTGKTTLIDAIFWGLYGYLPKWGGPKGGPVDAVIHRGEKRCMVRVTVEQNGDVYQIVRRRPSSLSVAKNQGDIPGKSGDLDDRIPELIGMSASQFLLSVYISQDRQTSFFTMTDTERTKLLSTIAGLENLNRALEKAKVLKDDIQKKLQTQSGAVAALEGQLARFPEERKHLEGSKAVLIDRLGADAGKLSVYVEELTSAVRRAEDEAAVQVTALEQAKAQELERLSQEFAKVTQERLEKNGRIGTTPKVEPEYATLVNQCRADLQKCEEENLRRAKIKADNAIARAALGQIAEKLEHGETCNECGQDLPKAEQEALMEKLMERAAYWEGQIKPEEPQIDKNPYMTGLEEAQRKLTKRTTELESEPNTLRQEVRLLDAQLAQIRRQSDMTQMDYDRKIAQAQDPVKAAKSNAVQSEKSARMELEKLHSQIDSADQSLASLDRMSQQITQDLEQNKIKALTLNKEMDEVLDLIDLFGPKGFRAVCFDGIIERISERAGQLLQLMTDHVYSSRIEQVGETAKGEERIQLKPVITKGGLEVPLDDLSGGARRMAMLAYDVAVSESVGESSVLFLDEALDGLDAMGKAEAMRLLEEVARNRAVMIIDHTSETKAAVNNVLRVTYQNGQSKLEGTATEEDGPHAMENS